jgi:hypothetical protein
MALPLMRGVGRCITAQTRIAYPKNSQSHGGFQPETAH